MLERNANGLQHNNLPNQPKNIMDKYEDTFHFIFHLLTAVPVVGSDDTPQYENGP